MTNALFKTPLPVNEPIFTYHPGSQERELLQAELQKQSQVCVEIPASINGNPIYGESKEPVRSPQNHQHILAHCYQCRGDDIETALTSTLEVRKKWANLPWEQRASVFLKAAELISGKYRYAINAATMLGQGKTVQQAEIDSACELIDFLRFNVHYMAEIYQQQPHSPKGMWNRSEVRPLEGFVYAITPFNFTAIAANLAASPAMMGCSVLWKPAPTSMLSSWIFMQILTEAGLPAGVINMIPGDPVMISEKLMSHPHLSGIHFTGSSKTFQHLWKTCGENIDRYRQYPRIVGETGGKDFIFAHHSADPEELIIGLLRGAFEYQGQKCSAASRAYIPHSLWEKIKDPLIKKCADLSMGDPKDFSDFLGAVIDKRAFDRIKMSIDRAKKTPGAEIIVGGKCDDQVGYFIEPTIIVTNDPNSETMTEELFGPVLTIFPYHDKDLTETIAHCNNSKYSLTGAIYGKDRFVLSELMSDLTDAAGNFYINDKPTGAVVGQQPFGGSRLSGTNDKAGSYLNLLRWTSHRTIKENFTPFTDYRYPHMDK